MQLRAPYIWNGPGPLLKDHAIGIVGDRIAYLSPIADAPQDPEVIDLPLTTLLPGFVNAHCHMDLSHLRGRAPFLGSFADWIRSVVSLRELLTENDVLRATRELQQSGVTSLLDHVGAFSELSYIMDVPFRKRLFMEVIGVTLELAAESLQRQQERALIARRDGVEATASPHATYSVNVETFRTIVNFPSPRPSHSIHCAESAEEWEMFTAGRGKLFNFLLSRGGTLDKATSPIQYLAAHNLLPHTPWLAVHCNTLTDDDIALLKKSQATVVHCPRSHRFFNHPPFPLEKLRTAGVPIAIGTDSLASCDNFDFLEELHALREEFPFLTTDAVLEIATCRCLAGGTFADIIGLPTQNDLLNGPITFSMIGGRRVI